MKFEISFERNGVYQANIYEAPNEATACAYFEERNPDAAIIGIGEHRGTIKPGMPVVVVPDGWKAAEPREMVSVDELNAGLDTGENGGALNDYRDSSAYICDAITEAADQRTSIYYCDILAFVREHPEALNDVVAEGLYDPAHDYDFYQHAQAAEYMTIERDIYDHLADSLMLAALDFIRYDLKRETIPAELSELLRGWCDDAENCDRMNDVPDRIREYFDEGDQP